MSADDRSRANLDAAAVPLEPPTADVAQAYLDELDAVEQRREEWIDRRMLGWLHLTDGVVVGALLSVALSSTGANPSIPHGVLLLLVGVLFWMELAKQLRDRTGVRLSWFRSWSLPYMLVFLPTLVIAMISLADVSGPNLASEFVFLPFCISVVVFGFLAAMEWRKVRGTPRARMRSPEEFTRGAAILTAAVGVYFGALIAATGVQNASAASMIGFALMCLLAVFMIALQTGSWMPVLGNIWRWPQWMALVIAGFVFVTAIWARSTSDLVTMPVAFVAGSVIVVLFGIVAIAGVRNERWI